MPWPKGRPHPKVPTFAGRQHTPEARAAISAALAGKPRPRSRGNQNAVGQSRANDPIIGECVYCGGTATTRDHVIPRGRPGWDTPDNVVPACKSCNAMKKNRTPDEWWKAMTA